jgi:hypothetical protein
MQYQSAVFEHAFASKTLSLKFKCESRELANGQATPDF